MHVQPYLFFDGRCEEAVEFYRRALGAKVEMLMRYKDAPESAKGQCPDGTAPPEDWVMHVSFRIGESRVMASDGPGQTGFNGFSLALAAPNEAEADRLFEALGDGGQVQMPLGKTFFSPRFGMVADRFGVSWMIVVVPAEDQR
jgi:PhnB protein